MFDAANWFWFVAGDVTLVYGSAAATTVPVSDAAYIAWSDAGNQATSIDSEENLADVLLAAGVRVGDIGTPAQKASVTLAEKIAQGIAITSTGNPALDATYALDSVSTAQVYQIGLFASQFDTFPGGATQPYPDATGVPHVFTVAQFVAFLRVVAPLVSALTTQAQVMAHGGTPSWPAQTATIV